MKCYYDPAHDAVGTCKSCGKGLSPSHLTDLGKGLACRGRCEGDVQALITMIDRNLASWAATNQILKRSSLTAYGTGTFVLIMGLIFVFVGLRNPNLDFPVYLGGAFTAYGLWTLLRSFRHAAIVSRLPDDSPPNA